jgi:hypothetical protein
MLSSGHNMCRVTPNYKTTVLSNISLKTAIKHPVFAILWQTSTRRISMSLSPPEHSDCAFNSPMIDLSISYLCLNRLRRLRSQLLPEAPSPLQCHIHSYSSPEPTDLPSRILTNALTDFSLCPLDSSRLVWSQ